MKQWRDTADRWFQRQPPWRRGAVIGAFAYASFATAFVLSDAEPWPSALAFALRVASSIAFGGLVGGLMGGAYGATLAWCGRDRLRDHMLAGSAAMAVLLLPWAWLLRELIGPAWPLYGLGAAVLTGAGALAPLVRVEKWTVERRRSRNRVA